MPTAIAATVSDVMMGLRRMLLSASLTLYLNIRTFPVCADGLQLPAILSLPGRETEFVTSLDAVNREKV